MSSPTLRPALAAASPALPLDRQAVLLGLAAFGIASFFLHQTSLADVAFRLALPDNDDIMRLIGVRDLIGGQSWFDAVQHRYLPPNGASLHWSRFVDAPIAALILAFSPVLGMRLAEGAAAALWPTLLFMLYLAAVGLAARKLFGLRAACFGVFAATQMGTAALFAFGRIDHHNIQAIAMLLVALGVASPDRTWRKGALAGVLAAFSLAVGLETLPFVACAGLVYVAAWIGEGERSADPLKGYAAGLSLTPLFFVGQTSPQAWLVAECDALSPPWLLLTVGGATAAFILAASGAMSQSRKQRLILASGLGAALAGSFAALYPECLGGPYSALPEIAKKVWLAHVLEAEPLWSILGSNPLAGLGYFAPLLTAACISTFAAFRLAGPQARIFGVLAAFLWIGVVLCLVQIRGAYVGSTFIPLVAAWTLDRIVLSLRDPAPAWRRTAALGIALLLFGKFWTVPIAAAQFLQPAPPASAKEPGHATCTDPGYLQALNQLTPGIVLSQIDLGTHLLLRTHHQIVAAPYHRNAEGLLAGIEAFIGSEADVKRHLIERHADYLVICPGMFFPDSAYSGAFARRLMKGERVPWLQPLAIDAGPLRVWRFGAI